MRRWSWRAACAGGAAFCIFLIVTGRPSSARQPPSTGAFPFSFTPETGLEDYERVRVEGESKPYMVRNAVKYYQKWFRKKYGAPKEELAHFDAQRKVYRDLMQAASPRSAAPHVRLATVGDLMWIKDNWDKFVWDDVRRELEANDVVLGNLETPIDRNAPVPGRLPDYLAYNSAPGLVRSFRRSDGRNLFDVMSFANNHTFDGGDGGAAATLAFLQEEQVAATGVRLSSKEKTFVVIVRGGIKIGVYATTWGFNDPDAASTSKLLANRLAGAVPEPLNTEKRDIDIGSLERALDDMKREGVDFKVVLAHWGHEFEYYPTPVAMQLARRIVAAGADLIIGAHPHVQQPNEVCFVDGYPSPFKVGEVGDCRVQSADGQPRKALIAYSLGNFTTNMWTFACEVGTILSLDLRRDASGRVDWHTPRHTFVHNNRAAAAGRRLTLLQTYLDGRCDGTGCRNAEKETAAFLEALMTGRHAPPDEIRRLSEAGARQARILFREIAEVIRELEAVR